MDRDIVIIGDLHLVDFEPRQIGSRSYKDPRFSIDESFSAFLRWIDSNIGSPFTLVINGDFIDFDLVFIGPGIDVDTAKRKLDRVFIDHRILFEAIVRLLADGENRLVLILGNHDLEFIQTEFCDYLLVRLSELAAIMGRQGFTQDEFRRRISIEPWFYYERDLFYAEHGDRFDRYCTSPRPLDLSTNPGLRLPFLSLGSLSNRYILQDLPTFNPFMDEQVIRRLSGYLGHLIRHYLIPPYRLPYLYLKGAIRVFYEVIRQRKRYLAGPDSAKREQITDLGRKKGLQEKEILGLWKLGKKSVILTSPFRVFHILWLDRVCIFCLLAMAYLTTLVVGLSTWPALALIPLMVLLHSLYELPWGKKEVLKEKRGLQEYAEQIGQILHTPHVVLSHSHLPEDTVLNGGIRYLNCGSWATIFEDEACALLWSKGKTFVRISLRGGRTEARLMRWTQQGPVRVETSERSGEEPTLGGHEKADGRS